MESLKEGEVAIGGGCNFWGKLNDNDQIWAQSGIVVRGPFAAGLKCIPIIYIFV